MKKETYFFSHDCNARNDEKILMLRADHGMEGYGIYWALIEMMFETSETCLSHDKVKGIDLLIKKIALTECPENYELIEPNRKEEPNIMYGVCKFGFGEHEKTCIECFKQAIELEYESEEE